MKKIEFIEGEQWCRWKGVLMSPENYIKQFGIESDPDIADDLIEYDGVYYTDMSFGDLVLRLAEWFGEIHGNVEPYDEIVNEGRGWASYIAEEKLANKLVLPIERVKKMEVKPFKQFKKDFPNFKQKKWENFQDDLDAYYKKLHSDRYKID